MYCMKYAETVNRTLVILLFSILFCLGCLTTFAGIYTGITYELLIIYRNHLYLLKCDGIFIWAHISSLMFKF